MFFFLTIALLLHGIDRGSGVVLAFGDHRLDIDRRELRRGAELVVLPPKAFDLLVFLVQHRGRVVGKDDLLREIWGGRIVSESAITTRINAVRRALGDDGTTQRLVRTFIGRGVRFVGEVRDVSEGDVPTIDAPNEQSLSIRAERRQVELPDKPSIAVLPFENMSGDPEQEYFVDGMVEEIITALSRIRWLFVIARNSTFTYKGQAVDVRQVGCELGVRYVLEGSVRKAGQRVRITGTLVDAVSGTHLWADRFDGTVDDIFELQDKVAFSVAGVIEPTLIAAEIRRSTERPTTELTAYDLYLRSLKEFPHPLPLLEEAIARDPYFGPALAHAAMACVNVINLGSGDQQVAIRSKGLDFAHRALKVIGEDSRALIIAAFSLAALGEDITAMMALVDRGLTANPSSAQGWFLSSVLRLWSGQPDLAIDHVGRAQRLNPRAQNRLMYSYVLGAALFFTRHLDEAAAELVLAVHGTPNFPTPYRYLAACYAHAGRLCEAREVMVRLRAVTPIPIPDFPLPLRNPEHREFYLSGLHLAAGHGDLSAPCDLLT